MPVLGIGGFFFRARDPEALGAWYRDHLDVGNGCVGDPGAQPQPWSWMAQGGPVIFAPFNADTDYFAADKAYLLNLRVSDLDGLIARLKDARVAVTTKPEWDDPMTGRFARIHDPEGNGIELWEPPAKAD